VRGGARRSTSGQPPVIALQEAAMRRRTTLVLLLLVACGTARGGPNRGSSDLLTHAEIAQSNATNAYDLLQQLRPQYLRSRGTFSIRDPRPAYPVVYVQDIRHGDLSSLRTIMIDAIEEVRFLSASDATTRWGTGHPAGVIHVMLNH
jgi:hypothetical protein